MSANRRLSLRKGKNNSNNGNQSISNFVQTRSKDVEIIENDEVQVTDEYVFSDAQTVQRPLRRKKKNIAVIEEDDENDSVEFEGMDDMDEAEKQQMKEALRQSCLELEKDKKRREIYNKILENSKSEIPATSQADIPSSPISSSLEPSCVERPESPDLFGPTPQSNTEQDKKSDIPSSEPGSLKNDLKSYRKSPFKKEINIQLSPIQRPLLKRNLSAKFDYETSPDNELLSKNVKTSSSAVTSKDKDKINKNLDSRKRKHSIEDDSDDDIYDGAKGNIKATVTAESRKRQKTIEDNFLVLTPKKENKEQSKEPETKHFVIDDDDDTQDGGESDNRNVTTKRQKKSSRVSLKRKYSHRRPIKTIRDAMKARLFFAPPGIDQKMYTFAIMRMLDHTKERIRKACQRSCQFVKWSSPIVAGPREDDSLDAKKDKRRSNRSRKESLEPPEMKTRTSRKPRNTQSKDTEPTEETESSNPTVVKTEKESTEKTTKTNNIGYVTSDESDEELSRSVFGNKESNPKSWKEYNSKTGSCKFGENVNISATRVAKDDVKNNTNVDKELKKNREEHNVSLSPRHEDISVDSSEIKLDKEMTCELDNTDKKETFRDSDGPSASNMCLIDDVASSTYNQKSPMDRVSKKSNMDHNICPENGNSPECTTKEEKASSKKSVSQENDSDTNDSDDSIDSDVHIGKLKVRRLSRKAAVIKDIEEEAEEKESTKTTEVDVEMVDIDDLTPTESSTSKPGESLSNFASKSGYLKISRTENKPPAIQRKVTPAVQKAADAAEKRMRQQKKDKASKSELSNEDPVTEEKLCMCPICYSYFPLQDIEVHADGCNGTPPEIDESSEHSRRVIAPEQGQGSSNPQQAQEYGWKDLRVVVTRSPKAHQRLLKQQEDNASLKAKKNLSLFKRGRMDAEKMVTEIVDMTSDGDDTPEQNSNNNNKSCSKEDSQRGSHGFAWLTTKSQETRQKAKFKVTYSMKKRILAQPKNLFSPLDYIPLQEQASSSDSESDHTTGKLDDSRKTNLTSNGIKTTSNAHLPRNVEKQHNDYVDIDNSSEEQLLSVYGAKKPKAVKNINVPHPQKQDLASKKKKKKRNDEEDEVDDANERALMELAGISSDSSSNHQFSSSGNEPKASKRRCKRATISSDDSEENDDYMLCYVCNKQVLKEIYHEHTNTCIDKRPGDESNTAQPSTRSSTSRQTARPSTSNTVEMDSDEIGDSPIKTFKLIGEGGSSTVDYENQFAFFEGRKTRSSSKRGSKRARGRGRSSYKKKYWKKRNNYGQKK